MQFQKTIKNRVEFSGVALHSGHSVKVVLSPAKADNGIVFVRADMPERPQIKAVWKNVVDTQLSTMLGDSKTGARIATVEHLLSALKGLDIDNVMVEVYGPELPILDGSSSVYYDEINKIGVEVQDKTKKYLQVIKPVSASIDDKFVYFLPSKELKITCRVNYKHPSIGLQHMEYVNNAFSYGVNISKAKTFGFLHQVEELQKKGLVLGGSYENAIVLGGHDVVNKDQMSYQDEFVRHKILDIIGDMALVGSGLLAHIVAYKSGHNLHALAVKELFEHSSYFKYVEEPLEVDDKAFIGEVFSLLDPISSL